MKMKTTCKKKSCWFMHKNKHKVSLNLLFLSSLWRFKVERSQANWPKRGARTLALGSASWRSLSLHDSNRRKKEKFQTNSMLIFMNKSTTFLNTNCFHFHFEPILISMACTQVPLRLEYHSVHSTIIQL